MQKEISENFSLFASDFLGSVYMLIKKNYEKSAFKALFKDCQNSLKVWKHIFVQIVSTKGLIKILLRFDSTDKSQSVSTRSLIEAKKGSLFPLKVW